MTTEIYHLQNEIKTLCITVPDFPQGVLEAFQTLAGKLQSVEGRTNYGISWMDKTGKIIYKAAISQREEGEAQKLNCESFTIRKGAYISVVVSDFMKNIPAIGETFRKLYVDPRVDTNGYCVEIYFNDKDVRCMVTLDSSKI
jgi:hypothetical protein